MQNERIRFESFITKRIEGLGDNIIDLLSSMFQVLKTLALNFVFVLSFK